MISDVVSPRARHRRNQPSGSRRNSPYSTGIHRRGREPSRRLGQEGLAGWHVRLRGIPRGTRPPPPMNGIFAAGECVSLVRRLKTVRGIYRSSDVAIDDPLAASDRVDVAIPNVTPSGTTPTSASANAGVVVFMTLPPTSKKEYERRHRRRRRR